MLCYHLGLEHLSDLLRIITGAHVGGKRLVRNVVRLVGILKGVVHLGVGSIGLGLEGTGDVGVHLGQAVLEHKSLPPQLESDNKGNVNPLSQPN